MIILPKQLGRDFETTLSKMAFSVEHKTSASGFAPYRKYGGWAEMCCEAGHEGHFELTDVSLPARAFRVLQQLDTWTRDYDYFVQFYWRHQQELDYLCSPAWPAKETLTFSGRTIVLEIASTCSEYFVSQCARGEVIACEWAMRFITDKSHTIQHVLERGFRTACEKGHVCVLQYLQSHMFVSEGLWDSCFKNACFSGQLAVLDWLKDTYANTISIKPLRPDIVLYACRSSSVNTLEYLYAIWPDVFSSYSWCEEAYLKANMNGDRHVIICMNALRNLACYP